MPSMIDRRLAAYGIAIASTGVAILLSLWLQPFLERTIGACFYIAVMVTTLYCGFRPGMVTIVFSTLAINYFFMPPLYQFTTADLIDSIRLGVFALVAFVLNLLTSNLQQSQATTKQLSQQLTQEGCDRLQRALAAVQIGVWDWNLVTGEIAWSPEQEQLFGFVRGSFDGRYATFEARLHPDDRPSISEAIQQALQHRTLYQHEYRVLWTDGSVHWLESRGQTTYNEAGQAVRMSGTMMNIDQRKQSEMALTRSEQQLCALFDAEPEGDKLVSADGVLEPMNPAGLAMIEVDPLKQGRGQNVCPLIAPAHQKALLAFIHSDRKHAEAAQAHLAAIVASSQDAIISKTLDGVIVSWNASAEKLFGYSAAEAIGQPIRLIIPPNRLEEEGQFLTQIRQGESIQQYETVRRRKDGTLVDIALTLSPVRDARGTVVGASKIARDITEQRALNRMKTEFISIVSHELRTPLTAIRGSLGLILQGVYDKKPDKKRRMVEIAAEQSDRLVRLVNDILDLQRLESGSMKLALQACDAAALMQQAADAMRAYAEEHQVYLSVAPLPVSVWAAPDAMIQTLTNLLSNAIKFSPIGGQIWLSAEPALQAEGTGMSEAPACPFVRFAIKDLGRGIPSDKLEIVFERFQQVDASDARDKGGTGLGLAICRKIIEQHGGRIWAESRLGEGSTFYFTLPMVGEDAGA